MLLPLLIELGLLSALLLTLSEIDQDRKVESTTIRQLQSINRVLNGVAQCGNFLIFKAPSPDSLVSVEIVWERMKDDLKDLKRFVADEKIKSVRTDNLIAAVDKLVSVSESFSEELDFNQELSNGSKDLTSALSPLSTDIAKSGELAIKEQLQRRQRIGAQMHAHEKRLEEIVQKGTVATISVAALSALLLFLRLWQGMRILMTNTTNIAVGKKLLPVMKGRDELSRLDGLIHSLSDDLNNIREKERALLDNTSAIVCSCEENLRITEVNSAVEKMLGYAEPEINGVILSSLVLADDRDKAAESFAACLAAPGAVTFEIRFKHKYEGIVITEVTANWSHSNQKYFLTIQDVSERKKFERQKAEVMELISSDLRAPLALILANLEKLSSGAHGQFSERGQRLAKNSTLSVTALMSLVNDLVDIERFESDTLTLSYSSNTAESLFSRSVDMVKATADRKKLSIKINAKHAADGSDINVNADGERIIRVIVNLLGNAIKFSPEQSEINLICTEDRTAGGADIKFLIKDEGPGIPEEKLGVVFEKFKQAGLGTSEEKAGSGLGLAICRAIVEAHGGTIGVESIVDQGSTFWFRIPSVREESKT